MACKSVSRGRHGGSTKVDWDKISDWGRRHPLPAFGLAIVLAGCGLLVRVALGSSLAGFPFVSFFPAIMLATFLGGRTPGAVCALLSTAMAWVWLISPLDSFTTEWRKDVVALLAFCAVAALVVAVIDGLVRAQRSARRSAAECKHLNDQLEARVIDRTRQLTLAYEQLRHESAERVAAEEQVRQLQRLESMGQLTGGIAHDFNNMLSIVMGNLSLASHRLAQGERTIERYIDAANEGATRAAGLTRRLLAFARRQPLQPAIVNVKTVIAGMCDMLARALGERVQIETALAAEGALTEIDPGQFENAVLNLAVNARDAMPDGGTLRIGVQSVVLAKGQIATDLAAGEYVLVTVADSGTGMAPETALRAFEPFFSTKDPSRGTGLGLSQVYGFVKQSGGHVAIDSALGRGTTIALYLRRYNGGALPRAEPERGDGCPSGSAGETILVVEDDPGVRAASVESLRLLGYTVIEAEDGPAGLAALTATNDITLLFTDVVMPGMSGRELAEAGRALRPDLQTLYTTGYTRDALFHGGRGDSGVALLQKPFTIEQLARKMRVVLDRAG